MKLSNQAMGALMMALQKCLMEEIDIVDLLQDMNFQASGEELVIINPPVVSLEGVTVNNVSEMAALAMDDVDESSTEETV